MTPVVMRRASESDIPQLEIWDEDPAVVHASGEDDTWDWREEITFAWQEVWLAEIEGRPIGVLVLLDAHAEPSHYWGEVEPGTAAIDIWIGSQQDRGLGYGRQMMMWALRRAISEWKSDRVVIDPLMSNTRAINFYRSCGFTDVGERFFGNDHCWVLEFLSSSNAVEAFERWGDTDAYAESTRRTGSYSKETWQRIRTEAQAIEENLAELKRAGVDPKDPAVLASMEDHRAHIDRWFYPCSVNMHKSLVDMYVQDERFTKHYDAIEPGLAKFMQQALRVPS